MTIGCRMSFVNDIVWLPPPAVFETVASRPSG